MAWWLVLADDDATIEGSWGLSGSGVERNGSGVGGGSQTCGTTSKNVSNVCGR